MILEKCLRKEILDETLTRTAPEEARSSQKIWLDKNENLDEEFLEFLGGILRGMDVRSLSTYPNCKELYQRLAEYEGVDPAELLLTAGSDGAIRAVFEAAISPGDTVIHTSPTFAMYPVYCRIFGAKAIPLVYERSGEGHGSGPVLFTQTIQSAIRRHRPKLVCLPNPDSPTGTAFGADEMRAIIQTAGEANSLILVDEAYFPFYEMSVIPWIKEFPHLIVARTFAKAWGLAGLRIGFAAANKTLCQYLHKVRPMYEVNTLAVRFMEKMLNHGDEVKKSVQRLNEGKDYFLGEMNTLGFSTLRTHGNFFHVDFSHDTSRIHESLDGKILYRKSFQDPCLKGYTRLTVTTKRNFAPIVEIIKKIAAGK